MMKIIEPYNITDKNFSNKNLKLYESSDENNMSYNLSTKHNKHNKYTMNNILKGKEGESMVKYFLENKWGFPVEGNDLDNKYSQQHGPDLWHEESGFYGEVKNNNGKYYYDRKDCDEQIVPRFPENARFKVLFMAHNTLTKNAREYLDLLNIKVVEWGQQLLGQSWKSALYQLYSSMWRLYYRLYNYFIPKVVSSISYISSTISPNRHNILDKIELITNKLTNYMDNNIIDTEKEPLKPPPDT